MDESSSSLPSHESPLINHSNIVPIKEDNLDHTLTSWLEDLNESVRPILDKSPQQANISAQKVLIYIISPSKGSEAFIISPITASILKNGVFGSQRKSYRIDNVESYS